MKMLPAGTIRATSLLLIGGAVVLSCMGPGIRGGAGAEDGGAGQGGGPGGASGSGGASGGPGGASGGPGGGPASGGSGGGSGGASCDPSSPDLAGCPCTRDGERRACGSDVGACRKGEQTCRAGFGTAGGSGWGPCEGGSGPGTEKCADGIDNDCDGKLDCDDPQCDDFCKGRDAGPDGPPFAPPMCVCIPGKSRWCHENPSCTWGKQDCLPDGTWGACKPAGSAPPGCGGSYNFCCCVAAGQCCDDDQDGALKGGKGESAGKCDGILCAPPKDPSWPPKATCPGVGECVPGAERWCRATSFLSASWGKQVCKPDGSWGDCTKTGTTPAGCSGSYNTGCCLAMGHCCHRFAYCSEKYSIGKCDGIACR